MRHSPDLARDDLEALPPSVSAGDGGRHSQSRRPASFAPAAGAFDTRSGRSVDAAPARVTGPKSGPASSRPNELRSRSAIPPNVDAALADESDEAELVALLVERGVEAHGDDAQARLRRLASAFARALLSPNVKRRRGARP